MEKLVYMQRSVVQQEDTNETEEKCSHNYSQTRFRLIYLVILQTQETSAKAKSGRCRRGHQQCCMVQGHWQQRAGTKHDSKGISRGF